jgi:microcystin-dependent protein
MMKLTRLSFVLLTCTALFGASVWQPGISAEQDDIAAIRTELNTLKDTVRRQLVDSPPNVPVGSILAYAGPVDVSQVIPTGWRVCDGSELSRSDFATLFTKIGESWGRGNGTTTFNLPDLRGRFLRGVDGGSGNDPDATDRINRDNQTVGGIVGSLQLDAVIRHRHLDKGHGHGASTQAATRGGESVDCDDEKGCVVNGDEATNATVSIAGGKADLGNAVELETELSVRTARETRPKNAYVNWIIRVK